VFTIVSHWFLPIEALFMK